MICDLRPVKIYFKVKTKGGKKTLCHVYMQIAEEQAVIKQQYNLF